MKRYSRLVRSLTITVCLISLCPVAAQEPKPVSSDETNREQLYNTFSEQLNQTALVGTFTVDGDQQQTRRPERYEIRRVTKLEQGDYWNFFARIKYGDHDVTVPIPVEVKWAGTTPVITVDNLTIPGMGGAFDARVVISDKKYAGTWRHGDVGGLMFGHIEPIKNDESAETEDGKTE